MTYPSRALSRLHRELLLDALSLARWFDEHKFELDPEERWRYRARLKLYQHMIERWDSDKEQVMGGKLKELEIA